MIEKIFRNILYVCAILFMVFITAWGGAWLYKTILEQFTKLG